MKKIKGVKVSWIIAAAVAAVLAATAFFALYPGLVTSDYVKYRIVAGKFRQAGVLDDGYGGFGESMTRLDFARLMNRAFGITVTSEVLYADEPDEDAALEINRAVTQGYMELVDGRADPEGVVTRQQAAEALSALLRLPSGSEVALTDAADIDPEAQAEVFAVVDGSLLTAPSGRFRPQEPLTVSEAVLMLQAAVGAPFSQAGTYTSSSGSTIYGNATLSAADVALCDTTVIGDVYITEGAGEGTVTLDNVTIEGRLLIAGASGVLLNDVTCGQAIIDSPYGRTVRVMAMGNTRISVLQASSGARLEESSLTGEGWMDISIAAGDVGIELIGSADNVDISAEGVQLTLDEGSFIRSATVWTSSDILGEGSITTLTVHEGPVSCEMIPETTDILTDRAVTLGGRRFSGTQITVTGNDLKAVMADTAALAIGYQAGDTAEAITADVTLPEKGDGGSSITWTSSDPSCITAKGVITRADYPLGDKKAVLTAEISRGDIKEKVSFPVTVLQKEITPQQSVDLDKESIEIMYGAGDSADGIIHDIILPTSGPNGTTITWASSSPGILDETGKVDRLTTGSKTVTLTATVTKEDATATREFKIVVKKQLAYSEKEMLQEDKDTLRIVFAPGDNAGSVTQSMLLPGSGVNGSLVTWASSQPGVVAANGQVVRPAAAVGNQTVTLTATLVLGDLKTTKSFTVTVIALAPEPTAALDPTPEPSPEPPAEG